jgi:hypothetical protein
MKSIDFIDLIENNSIKLSGTYDNEILNIIQNEFNESQKKLYVAFSYCQFNYDDKNDFIIDISNIWEWLGFSEKKKVIDIIQENYTQNGDYIIMYHKTKDNDIEESFLLNMNTFSSFCRITNNTWKTIEINNFFKKLEIVCDVCISDDKSI